MQTTLFYRMWPKSENSSHVMTIEENDRLFLESLRTIPLDYDRWLRGMLSYYVKSRRYECEGDDYTYRMEWIEHTLLIVGNNFPIIENWCKDYKQKWT